VLKKLSELKQSPPNTEERELAQNALLREMRKDLGFA